MDKPVVLHRCGGVDRWFVSAEKYVRITCINEQCGAPVAADQPFLLGHSAKYCPACFTWIGFCAGGLLEGVVSWAEDALKGA